MKIRPRSQQARRAFVQSAVVAMALALSVFAVTCDSDDSTGTTLSDDGVTVADGVLIASSDLDRLPASAPAADVEEAAAGTTLFGAELYARLADAVGDGNLVFSPNSIVTALAMTYAGAAGTTATEMAETLHFTLDDEALHAAFNALDKALESRNLRQKNAEGQEEGVLIKTANSLWAQQDLPFTPAFLDTLASQYGAGVRLVDYKTAAEAAREAINQWVSDQTEEEIPELIDQGTLDALTRLVLVNAIYLDATWASQFDPQATHDGAFTTLSGDEVTTPLMSQSTALPFADGGQWKAVELPYLGNELAMLLIVPESGAFAEVEGQMADGLIDEVVGRLAEGNEVSLTLPKFSFRTHTALNDLLSDMGMVSPFDSMTADFSGMTTQESLYISDVIHEAFIEVDEEGTEAAAATAVVMRLTAAPVAMVELTVDRPFLFAIRDRATGSVLFLGRVADPTE